MTSNGSTQGDSGVEAATTPSSQDQMSMTSSMRPSSTTSRESEAEALTSGYFRYIYDVASLYVIINFCPWLCLFVIALCWHPEIAHTKNRKKLRKQHQNPLLISFSLFSSNSSRQESQSRGSDETLSSPRSPEGDDFIMQRLLLAYRYL